ncbi:MAG: acyl-CoA dehydrogenase family protein, partial [Pseudonocardia sp.]
MQRRLYEQDHEAFREAFRAFLEAEAVPRRVDWDVAGIVDRDLFAVAGKNGFLGPDVPETYGGAGVTDFRFNAVVAEECMRAGLAGVGAGLTLHNDVCMPYLLEYTSAEQKLRWLPGVVSGQLITAIAMTEPGTGSDLASIRTTAVREGDHYVVNGSKTFITNGINADLVITAVKTDPSQRHGGVSLVVLERGMPGFERGRKLEKLGLHAQDTAELNFTDVRVPVANLLGDEEGRGFRQLTANLPRERLSIAVSALAGAAAALEDTLRYVKDRRAFGTPIGSFQYSRFVLAELATDLDIAQLYVDRCIL